MVIGVGIIILFKLQKKLKRWLLITFVPCYLLNNFILSTTYNYIIISWVMDRQIIIEQFLSKLDLSNCDY